eukprot:6202225-Pleurochrysis_carterae.AAC.2
MRVRAPHSETHARAHACDRNTHRRAGLQVASHARTGVNACTNGANLLITSVFPRARSYAFRPTHLHAHLLACSNARTQARKHARTPKSTLWPDCTHVRIHVNVQHASMQQSARAHALRHGSERAASSIRARARRQARSRVHAQAHATWQLRSRADAAFAAAPNPTVVSVVMPK